MAQTIKTGVIRTIEWREDCLWLIDQRALPLEEVYLPLRTATEVAEAISDMVVRGAPAIGIVAAFGVVLAVRSAEQQHGGKWKQFIQAELTVLANSRPTAVNLRWALQRMAVLLEKLDQDPVPALLDEAKQIHSEDIAACKKMGAYGAELIEPGSVVLTHCNTGALATGGDGTALGVVRAASAQGRLAHVYVTETRPWLQGSRLTAWELQQEGIAASLITDSAASVLMAEKNPGWVIVGADRIAANGDTANKVGTYQLAVTARHHGVKFMVVAPTTTIDPDTASGANIPIEHRPGEEVTSLGGMPVGVAGFDVWNPVFDITPAALIDAIVTEKGVLSACRSDLAVIL